MTQPPKTYWPEAEWERLEPHFELDGADLTAILRATTDRDDIAEHTLLSGGKCNTNVRVRLEDDTQVVVRVYEQDANACRRDELITSLVEPTVPVPSMLAAVGEPEAVFGEKLAARLEGRPVGVFSWVEGITPMEAFEQSTGEVSAQIGYALGETLAGIGRARTFGHHGLLDAELGYRRRFESMRASFIDFIEWSLSEGRAGERLGPDLAGDVDRFAREHVDLLEATEGDFRLVHGDYKLSNLLVRPDGDSWTVAAVLDWEYALAGSPLFDAAILLRHVDHFPEGFEDAFARGFRDAGGVLPDRWREITKLLDLMNLCGFLNASGQRERLFEQVRGLVADTVPAV